MSYTIIIDGGLGRTICSIPALEKFINKNPDTKVISYWPAVYNCNKIIQPISYDSETKGLFDLVKDTYILKPEPYYNSNYINEKIHLIQGFDEELNKESELNIPRLQLTHLEYINGLSRLNKAKKTVCLQPFGSTANLINNQIVDNSIRSLSIENTSLIINILKKHNYDIVLMEYRNVPSIDYNKIISFNNLHYRDWFSIIANCDYFIGVDSSGQHIARSFNIPGTIFMGGTSKVNVSYEDHFRVVYKEGPRQYMPYRFCEKDYREAESYNWDLIQYSNDEITLVCEQIVEDIRKGK
jgi:hypothetical protein